MSIPFLDAAIPPVVWMIVQVSVLVAAAASAQALLRRRTSAATRHLMWTFTVVALLLLPTFSVALPKWEIVIPVAGPTAAPMTPIDEPAHQADVEAVPAGVAPTIAAAAGSALEASTPQIPWAAVLTAVYAAGVLLLVIRLARERLITRRLARESTNVIDPEWVELLVECSRAMGVRRPVRLLRSVESIMPMTFGVRQTAILIPAVADTWQPDRRRAVLLHELAHASRHDCLTQSLAAVACALYWIHPGVWWIARRLRIERELACDDRVLAAGTEARDYAGHLLELGYALGGGRAPALAVTMASPRQLEGRMLAVLDAARNRATPARRGRLTGLAITAALLIPVAAATTTVVPSGAGAPTTTAPAFESAQSAARPRTVAQDPLPGTWEIRPTDSAGLVHMRISESDGFSGRSIAVERLDGLSPALLSGAGGPAAFSVRADAGTFTYEGIFRNGVGAGTFTFTPNPTFPDELSKRGLERPTRAQQYFLAREDVGLAFLDELSGQGYERPSLVQLVRTAQHGVGLNYLRDMGRLGYRLGRVDALVNQRDHGVTPEFIRALAGEGFTRLSADDLVRARDHGVSPEYIRGLKGLGHRSITMEQLITLRDHGVSPEYIRALDQLGFSGLSLDMLVDARNQGISPEYVRELRDLGYRMSVEELTRARDNGVSAEYVREMAALGYQRLSLDTLVDARNHGISAEYAKELRDLGHRLTLDELKRVRDHGVSAEYIRDMAALGYQRLSLETLIRLRDNGVDPGYVGELKRLGYAGLEIEELIGLRNDGVTPDRISRANARAGTRLSVERLKEAAARGWR